MNQRKKFWQGIIYDEDEINNLIYSDKLKKKIFNTIHNLEESECSVGTNLEPIKKTDPKIFSARVDGKMRMLLTSVIRNGKPYLRYLGITDHNYNIPLITDHPASVFNFLDSERAHKTENKYFEKMEEKKKKEGEKEAIIKIKSYPISYLPVEFYDNKWIILNPKQRELLNLLAKNGLPLVLTGAPGAGKTMLGLMFTAQATDASQVTFYSPTGELLDEVQKQFENSECSKILTAQEKAKIGFKNGKTSLLKYFSEDKIKDENHCKEWIENYIDAKKSLKNLPPDLANSPENIIKIFSEFRNISGFTYPTLDKEAYINNNDRLSLFPRECRRFLWKAYRKYIKHLEANGLAHVDFTPLPIDPDNDEIYIIDESQLLSLLRIKNLCERARGRVFIAINPDQNCGDDNVSKLEFIKTTLNTLLINKKINKKIEEHQLPYTYRLPQNVVDGANILLKLIRHIDEGNTAQGQQNEIFGMLCERDIPGTINWFNPSQISLDDLRKLTASANCAVVTLPEFVEEAKRELGTDNVFTADEIIGLQFPIILGYKFFSGALFHQMLKEVSKLISEASAETILEGDDIRRTKDRDKKSSAFWSMLYILWTRVGESLVFYDDTPTSLENEKARKKENDLFYLYKFLIEHTATKEQIDPNNPKMDESKSNEAWLALIKKYITQERFELAKNNFLNRLKGKPEEFEKLKAQHMPRRMKATEMDSKDKDKEKEKEKDKELKDDADENQKKKRNYQNNQQKTRRTLAFETNYQDPAFEAAKQATTEGDVQSVKNYLNNEISLNTLKELLYTALKSGHIKVVELLLEHDRSLMNMPIKDNKTPLSIAVEEGRSTVVQFLLAFGANPNSNQTDTQKKSKSYSKIKVEQPIEIAVEKFDILTIDHLIAHGETLSNNLINTLLKQIKAQDPNLKKIKDWKLARNNSIVKMLKHAVKNGCTNVVKIFLALGWEQSMNEASLQSFMLDLIKKVSKKGHAPILKLLLSFEPTKNALNYFINTKTDNNKSPICLAAEKGHLEVVRLFLNNGVKADAINHPTPLFLAASNGHVDVAKLLLASDGGFTALYLAVEKGHIDVIRCLINAGANPNATKDNVSLLEHALEKGDKEIISLLKEYVCTDDKKESQQQKKTKKSTKQKEEPLLALNIKPKEEAIPLETKPAVETIPLETKPVVETIPPETKPVVGTIPLETKPVVETISPETKSLEEIDDRVEGIKREIQLAKAKLEAQDAERKTLLKTLKDEIFIPAIETGCDSTVANCLSGNNEQSTYLMNETYSGMAPIIFAATKGHPKVVEVLIRNREAKKDDLLFSLFIAVKNNNLPLANLLLNYVKPNGDNAKEVAVFTIAAKNGNVSVIKAFMKSIISLKTATEALVHALTAGNIRVVEILLQSEILKQENNIINMPLKDNKTPLYIAAENNKSELVNFLLRYGADPNGPQKNDALTIILKPLDIAAKNQNLNIVNMLLRHKSILDPESNENLFVNLELLPKDAVQNKKLCEIAQAQNILIAKAVENGHLHILRICLNRAKGGFKNSKIDEIKKFILKFINNATKNGHASIVEMLLTFEYVDAPKLKLLKKLVIDDINTQTKDGETAMYFAADKGHIDVIKVLVAHGVEVDPKQTDNVKPIYLAAQNGSADIVKYLLEQGANPNSVVTAYVNNKKCLYTSLGMAILKNNLDVVKILLSSNEIILDRIEGVKKRSYLHLAANVAVNLGLKKNDDKILMDKHDDTVLKMLLNDSRIDRNIPDMDGLTAYEDLKTRNRDDLLKLFDTIEPCAAETQHVPPQVNDSVNDESTDHNALIKFIADECVDFITFNELEYVIADDEMRQTVLIKALLKCNLGIVKILLELNVCDPCEILPLGILMTDDPHHEWKAQTTPLMLAAEKGQLEMVKLLLPFKADSTIKSEEGTQALYLKQLIFTATSYHHCEIVKMLLDRGVDPNTTDENGQSLLYLAIKENQPDIVADLLSRIKEQQLPDFDVHPFLSAITIASDKNSIKMVKVFSDHYLKYNLAIDNKQWAEKDRPLIFAVLNGSAEIVDILLHHNIIGCRDQAFISAVRALNNIETVKVFLKSGVITKELAEETCLHAANVKNDEALTLCLNYLKEKFKQQTTLLHLAIKFCCDNLVKTLIKQAGANLLNVKDNEGNTPLHLAVKTGNIEIVKLLLDHSEVKWNKQNNNQQTPLVLAVARKDEIGNQIITFFKQRETWKNKPKGQSLGLFSRSQESQERKQKTTSSVGKANSPANSSIGATGNNK